ncbi:hypothetical protein KR044_009537, partial [Drosophila immigrans]
KKEEDEKDPLSLEYATLHALPLHLRQLMSTFNGRTASSVELLTLLIYAVALESGYVEKHIHAEKRDELKPVPPIGCFHIGNVRLLSQQLPKLQSGNNEGTPLRMELRTLLEVEEAEESRLLSHLMITALGDLLIVTLGPVPPIIDSGFSICLTVGRYVINVQLEPHQLRFRKLDELTLLLREKLFQPMRTQQLLRLKLYRHPTLLGLPEELYGRIFRHLNENQLNIVANVNRQLCNYRQEFSSRQSNES